MKMDDKKNILIDANSANRDSLVELSEPLPEQVLKNVEAIINIQEQYTQDVKPHQRILDKIAALFGQPEFLYCQILFFIGWAFCSYLAKKGILPSNFPAFNIHDQGLDSVALLISTGVLIYQTRQEKLSEQRSHLTLQLNLLTEQKIAKLIALVEELRTDLPNVKNRYDLEAALMQQATDPQVILDVLQKNLEQPPSSNSEN